MGVGYMNHWSTGMAGRGVSAAGRLQNRPGGRGVSRRPVEANGGILVDSTTPGMLHTFSRTHGRYAKLVFTKWLMNANGQVKKAKAFPHLTWTPRARPF